MASNRRFLTILTIYTAILAIITFIGCADKGVWLFEIIVGIIAIVLLNITFQRFRFSNLAYWLVGIHYTILAVAAKYTYAEMPLFNWLRDTFDLSRNHYDRVGHFFQGFVPAIICREILFRCGFVKKGKMLDFICVSICLAVSAFWELLEWWMVIFLYPDAGPEWLGTQGDIWDAQSDMFMALCGATLAVILLSRFHDKSMAATLQTIENSR